MSTELPFQTFRIDGSPLLISGGVHGDEFTPMAAIREFRGLDPTELDKPLFPAVHSNLGR